MLGSLKQAGKNIGRGLSRAWEKYFGGVGENWSTIAAMR
jgi:hypothetical protein